jgi:copper chaperone CopZ
MKTYKFKTNINCGGCIKSATPYLDALKAIEWKIDTNDKRKVLEVKTENLTEQEIIDKVHEAGYEAQSLKSKGFLRKLFG